MICPECKIHNKGNGNCEYCDHVMTIPQKKIKIKDENVKDLVKELDRVFSIFIRTRYMDFQGIAKCFTCGDYQHWRKGDCGHYVSRDYKAIRWSEENTEFQCKHCNITLKGNYPAFTMALIRKHGPAILDKLEMQKNNEFKLERGKLKLLISIYTKKIEHIKL